LIIDATRGFEGQDQKVFLVSRKKTEKGCDSVNKWDLVEKESHVNRD
jgi:GTP-binding protein